ncbi:putativelike family protein [Phaeomoniella chlamydospora]|uniref:Putativelike family protein n=1 Tax=Phaeomoniella chlamydospora TaxID=158046 RepID=A0A0G2E4L9_PHACM|nr:putativelike family protein [Phaeomoniella chlamydospora]
MAIQAKHIAVAGVTGRLGNLIASYLLKFPNTIVHGFTRSPEKVPGSLSADTDRFKLFTGSAEKLQDVRKALAGCETVICAYNTAVDNKFMVDAQKVLIEACDAEGVSRYFASDYTGYYPRLEPGDLPIKDPMIKIYKYIRDGNFSGTVRVKPVHILAGAFIEAFLFFFFKLDDAKYWGTGNETWDFSSYETIAKYTAHVAVDEEAPTGILKFRDFQSNTNSIVRAIQTLKNRSITLKYQGSLEEAKQEVEIAKKNGTFLQNVLV